MSEWEKKTNERTTKSGNYTLLQLSTLLSPGSLTSNPASASFIYPPRDPPQKPHNHFTPVTYYPPAIVVYDVKNSKLTPNYFSNFFSRFFSIYFFFFFEFFESKWHVFVYKWLVHSVIIFFFLLHVFFFFF